MFYAMYMNGRDFISTQNHQVSHSLPYVSQLANIAK